MVAEKRVREQGVGEKFGAAPLLLIVLFGLGACDERTAEPNPPPLAPAGPVNPDAGVTTYRCTDGQTIVAGYPDPATAVVTYKSHAYTLKLAPAESGARYTGYGLQWWVNGRRAALAALKPGEERATNPGLACVATEPGATKISWTRWGASGANDGT
jgi:membrane-bound inhibitor of C-type lysozyme